MNKPEILIHGYRLQLTCFACPEQYDVYDTKGTCVGYLRLRHGVFTASMPDVGGRCVVVLDADSELPKGDGIFYLDERPKFLRRAIEIIQDYYINYDDIQMVETAKLEKM